MIGGESWRERLINIGSSPMENFPKDLQTHWDVISHLLIIRNEKEYNAAVKRLNDLQDEIGINEKHSLYTLLDTLGTLVHAYKEEHYPIPEATGTQVLRFLMDEHGLTQLDLPEVGSQGMVSEILNNKRELNVRQIRALSEKFNVSAAVFV
jgi:HTH-type transcriptional regulator/antitoxin HigA